MAGGVQRAIDHHLPRAGDAAITVELQRSAIDRRVSGKGLRGRQGEVARARLGHGAIARDRAGIGAVARLHEIDRRVVDHVTLQRRRGSAQRAAVDGRAARIAVRSRQRERAGSVLDQRARCTGRVGDRAGERDVIGSRVDRATGAADRQVRRERGRGGRPQRAAIEHRRNRSADHLRLGIGVTRAYQGRRRRGRGAAGQRHHRGSGGYAVQLQRREEDDPTRAERFAATVRNHRDAVEAVPVVDRRDEMLLTADRGRDAADQKRRGSVEKHVDL